MTTASNNLLHVHMGMSVLLKDRRVKAGTYSLMTTVGDFFFFLQLNLYLCIVIFIIQLLILGISCCRLVEHFLFEFSFTYTFPAFH